MDDETVIRRLTPKRKKKVRAVDRLSTGSTLLNLAFADRALGGLVKGKYYFFVGDSNTGKTWLTLTCFAEAMRSPAFKHYRIIHDNPEDGALMDLERFFGKTVARRVEPPAGTRKDPVFSWTVEDLYFHIDDAVKVGTPFIYVIDSMDALNSDADEEKFDERRQAALKGKEVTGTYGVAKAKANSGGLPRVVKGLKQTGSILIVISQSRDNLTGGPFAGKTRAGGRALRFYATVEVWTSLVKTLTKTVKGKDRQIGIRVKLEVKKNRITGKLRKVEVPLYWSTGIDDVGGCIEFMVEEKGWAKAKGVIRASADLGDGADLEFDELVAHVEANNLEPKLRAAVARLWQEIEIKSAVPRKRRYN